MKSQSEAILAYLKQGRRITPIDALNMFGCFRLAARISDLRSEGHNIVSENVEQDGKSFSAYRLAEGISRSVSASSFKSQGVLLEVPTIADYSNFGG